MPYSSEHLARLVQDEHTGQVIDLEHRVASASFGNGETLFAQLIRRTLAALPRPAQRSAASSTASPRKPTRP
jgi:hypothetical protein